MLKIFNYPSPLWRLRSAIGFLIVVSSVFIWGSYTLLRVGLGASQEWLTWSFRSWNLFVLQCVGLKVEVEGAENQDPNVPCLVISNHQSLFDIPASYFSLGGNLRMVAKKELFKIPIFGTALTASGFIPVDRNNRSSGQEATRLIAERIEQGMQVWVAPEGTRSPEGKLQAFKKGSFGVAFDNLVPVQPFVVLDSWRACPKGSLLPRPGTVIHVRILPRITPDEISKLKNRGELAEYTRQRMAAVFENASGAKFSV